MAGGGYASTYADDDASPVIDVQDAMLSQDSITAFVEQLTLVGAKLFSDDEPVACGLMLRRRDEQTLFCSASPVVTEMYQTLAAQHVLGEGPAPQALNASRLHIADNTSDPQYPPFFAVPASRGFASILSIPLTIGAEGAAALNFYARPVAFFTTDRQRTTPLRGRSSAMTSRLICGLICGVI